MRGWLRGTVVRTTAISPLFSLFLTWDAEQVLKWIWANLDRIKFQWVDKKESTKTPDADRGSTPIKTYFNIPQGNINKIRQIWKTEVPERCYPTTAESFKDDPQEFIQSCYRHFSHIRSKVNIFTVYGNKKGNKNFSVAAIHMLVLKKGLLKLTRPAQLSIPSDKNKS